MLPRDFNYLVMGSNSVGDEKTPEGEDSTYCAVWVCDPGQAVGSAVAPPGGQWAADRYKLSCA